MDATHRLKIKIGNNEFEAEGTPEVVQQQFDAFKELFSHAASVPSQKSPQPTERSADEKITPESPSDVSANVKSLSKIMRVQGRIVSLTVRPKSVFDAILVVLHGQKELRQNDSVTGAEIRGGITATGGFGASRVDRLLEALAEDSEVIVIGVHRAKRYRLTNTGHVRALQIASDLIAMVP